MWLSPSIVMSENTEVMRGPDHSTEIVMSNEQIKSPQTTIPFVKNNNFNYQWLTSWVDNKRAAETLGWLAAFVLVVIIVVAAVSNGANLTDGLDGLSTLQPAGRRVFKMTPPAPPFPETRQLRHRSGSYRLR